MSGSAGGTDGGATGGARLPDGADAGPTDDRPAEAPPPFAGLKVIDCASYIAGPAAATILGDLGAEVIKLEPPEGDPHRGLYQLPGTPPAEHNYAWALASRNKRSIALDLKHPEGQAVLHRLVAQADVFITNLPLPVRGRLALEAGRLMALNPRLVYASMTAYGETGPESAKPGFDITAYWARSGLMDMVRPDHAAPPAKPVGGMGDHPSAVSLFGAIVTALFTRERSGRGGLVSSSLLANGVWANGLQVQAHLSGARYAPRQPREQSSSPLSNIYRTADDRWLSLVVLNEAKLWPALVAALGAPVLADDPRFGTETGRRSHAVALVAALDAVFATRRLADWRARLDAAGITFGIVNTLDEMPDDAQMRATRVLEPQAHDGLLAVATPIRIHGSARQAPGPAPALGEHGEAILREAGLDDAAVRRLLAQGVVVVRPG